MVVINRRKTCYMGPASPFASIPEDTELPDGRRDSVESGGSDLRSSWARGDQWVDPLVGEFTLISTQNYDTFLAKVGAGPLSSNMVLRARINLTIKQVRAGRRPGGCTYLSQELDKQWRIRYETIIRAKSIKGYNTKAGKVTENKYQLEVERPELLDDWDQRFVMSTLSRDLTANRLTLVQTADKDQANSTLRREKYKYWLQRFCQDSTIIFEVDEEDSDILTMTCIIADVIAWRRFRRVAGKPVKKSVTENKVHRKYSCPI